MASRRSIYRRTQIRANNDKLGCNYLSYKSVGIEVEDFIRTCYDLRLDCLDFHLRAFPSTDVSYLLGIKRQCLDLGLPIGYLGVAGDSPETRTPSAPGSKTPRPQLTWRSFSARRSSGYSGWQSQETENRDPLFAALARCLREVSQYGAERGVVVALQNHDNRNLAATGPDCLRIIKRSTTQNFSFIMDTGQWLGSPGASGETNPDADIYGYMEQTCHTRATCGASSNKIASGKEESSTMSASPASSRPRATTVHFHRLRRTGAR